MSTTVERAFASVHLGAELLPDPAQGVDKLKVGRQVIHKHSPVNTIRFRCYLGDGAGNITYQPLTGVLATSAPGTRQVETLTITAAGGATSNGNLPVTVAHAALAVPVVVQVPLRTAVHTTAALIAAAVRSALAASEALAILFTVSGAGASVILTVRHPSANDGTFAVSVPATLGVSAATSANTTAGVAGALAEKLGGLTADMLGTTYAALTGITAIMVEVPYMQTGATVGITSQGGNRMFPLFTQGFIGLASTSAAAGINVAAEIMLQGGRATVDVILHLK